MDLLEKIKRLVLRGQIAFTLKAEEEMLQDGLDRHLIAEAILNAHEIRKRLRSIHQGRRESLYVIVGRTFDGTIVYTKGKIAKLEGLETFYVLISSKRSTG